MKPMRAGWGFALGLTMLMPVSALAGEKPVNLSIITPVSLARAEDSVNGFRFNLIYGRNTSVKVVDIGLVNHTTTLSSGLQWGFVNYNEGAESGLQIATLNINKGTTRGLQWASINYAENAAGLQVALVNFARHLDGVQIGAVNIIKEGGMFPVMVIANWSKK